MRKKFFLKNLLLFLFPLLIPTLILGSLSIFITQQYIQGETEKSNHNLFTQIERSVDLMFSEMDSLSISLGNPEVLYRLEEILRTQTLTLENLRILQTTQNFINAPANTRPYIESIYIYVENEHNRFLANGRGVTSFLDFHDVSWKETFYQNQGKRKAWTEARVIQRYSFEAPVPVMTLYKNLYSTVLNRPNGIIVLNIYSDYMDKLLKNIKTYPNQLILIFDENNHILLKNRPIHELAGLQAEQLSRNDASYELTLQGEPYLVSQMYSEKYGWKYTSVTPLKSLNQIPFRLSTVTVLLVLLSFVLGLALTYFLTRRSVNHIRRTISIIHSAERGLPLPEFPTSRSLDEYEFINQKIITNFIEQHYLQVQLSEKKYKLQAAELLALQSQMNPHFLFNTLETIYWKVMALTGKPNEVNPMLENLSEILKYSIDKPNQIVPLAKEITNTQSYIDIQKIRYRDQFDVIWDYDQDEVQRCSVMKLLLQPLIENSIYHGIKETEGKSLIKIKIVHLSSCIRISVIDNGIGMSKVRLAEVRKQLTADSESSHHIGLANTNKRIQLTYDVDQGIRILSKRLMGTVVTVDIPVE